MEKTKIILACGTLIVFIFLMPYLSGNYTTLIGYDAGFYMLEIRKYLHDIESLKNILAVFHEPGGIMAAMIFFKIPDLGLEKYMVGWLCMLLTLKTIILYLLAKKVLKNHKNALIFSIVFSFSNAYINSFYLFIYRQFFTDVFYFLFLYFYLFKNKGWGSLIIMGILGAQIYISHRGVSMVLFLSIICCILYKIFTEKKILKNIIFESKILFAITILVIPYFIASFNYNYIILHDFIIFTSEASNSTYSSPYQGASIYTGKQDPYGSSPWIIFFSDAALFSILIIILSNINFLRKHSIKLIIPTILIGLIVSTHGPFSQRIFYYAFFFYFLTATTLRVRKITIRLILIILLTIISGINYINTKRPGINYQPGIKNYLEKFDKEKSLFILGGSPGVLVDELGWRTIYGEAFSKDLLIGDQQSMKMNLGFNEFLAVGYKYPPSVKEDNVDVYVVISNWLKNINTSSGIILTKNWDQSNYYETIPGACSTTSGIFCNVYKLKKQKNNDTLEEKI